MTKVRKFLGAVMAAMLCFALTPAAAFAAAPTGDATVKTGSISLNNAVAGQTYEIYRILDLESYSGDAFIYRVADGWDGFINGEGADYLEVTNGYVLWKGDEGETRASEFAKKALAYASENKIAPAAAPQTAAGTSVAFTGLSLGYYVLNSSLGTLCSLTTNVPEQTITEKNDVPTLVKEVQEGNAWGEKNDAKIGDLVNFRSTIMAQPGAVNYVYHDTMSEGLTFKSDTIKMVDAEGKDIGKEFYTVNTVTSDCTFEVVFTPELCNSITNKNTEFVITYSATLNDKAFVSQPGKPEGTERNTNTGYLVYGDNKTETDKSITETKTWKLPIFKHTDGDKGLGDALFELLNKDNAVIQLVKIEGTERYRVALPTDDASVVVSEFKSPSDGQLFIEGLDSGDYKLNEKEAPEGYNKLAGALSVVISLDGDVTVMNPDGSAAVYDTAHGIKVLNQTGSMLPSTGGIGTTIFYIVGGLLVIGAVVFFVRRRSHATK